MASAAAARGKRITIRDLLDHRSGLFDYTADPRLLPPYFAGARAPGYVWTPRQLIGLSTSHPLVFAPGHGAAYSDTNYIVLGLVIEAATRHSLALELRRRILIPLRLRNTSLATRSPRGRYLHGYIAPEGVFRAGPGGLADIGALNASIAWAAGGLLSNAPDVATFYRALLSGRILAKRLVALMRKPLAPLVNPIAKSDAYGLGLYRYRYRCGNAWGHSGDFPGYTTIARVSASGRRAAVLVINTDTIPPPLGATITPTTENLFCQT